jgi:hypothetical protein
MEICGWWNTTRVGCPARSTNPTLVPLTSYWCRSCGDDGTPVAVFAIANYGGAVNVSLDVDWAALELDARTVKLSVPLIAGVQKHMTLAVGQEILVPADLGWLVVASAPTRHGGYMH